MADSDSPDDIDMEEEDFMLPITEIDFCDAAPSKAPDDESDDDSSSGASGEKCEVPERPKPLISRRAKRHSLLYGTALPQLEHLNKIHEEALAAAAAKAVRAAPAAPVQIQRSPLSPTKEDFGLSMSPKVKVNWMKALKKVKSIEDPWECYHIENLPTEHAIRHRYNALKKKWMKDEVDIKMEKEPFNHGAMRECYRLKKVSSFSRSKEWSRASNYVAKRYMEDVERDVYFEDVKLQMDAKLWGEEYNRHNPPKKVDIFQMYVIELTDRPDKPLLHLEHFIEGNYIKYNSNSGFVDESQRFTPQAFSHFTFERSGHTLIVVDVQGVGDLWTDPQIHTDDGKGYGDGNLGVRGMALFFHSHTCNSICDSLGLSTFDRAHSEIVDTKTGVIQTSATQVRGAEQHCFGASGRDRSNLTNFLLRSRSRTTSMASTASSEDPQSPRSPDGTLEDQESDEYEPMSPGSPAPSGLNGIPGLVSFRHRYQSESSDSSSTLTEEEERLRFQEAMRRRHRPSCINAEINLLNVRNILGSEDSVLGQIHHELAKYHELGRFTKHDNDIDMDAAIFHEQQAAELGVLEARLTLARLYLGLQRDVLVNFSIEENDENTNRGLKYMEQAAEGGDRPSMIHLANCYETGYGLGTERSRSYVEAVHWLEKAVETAKEDDDDSTTFDSTMDNPTYMLQAKLAELYLSGEFGLEKDPNYAGEMYTAAAEAAMAAMKGRLANKYYMLAEEAWGQVEED